MEIKLVDWLRRGRGSESREGLGLGLRESRLNDS